MHATHPLLPASWKAPERFHQRLGSIAGKQRAMEAEGHLLLVLHETPDRDSSERRSRLFWRSPDGSWKSTAGGTGARAVEEHVQQFIARIDELEAREERAGKAADYFELLQEIVPLHRTTRDLHATLQQAREAIPDDRDLIHCRDLAGEAERAVELLHADVQNGLQYTVAYQSEQQSHRAEEMAVAAHRLNVLAAIFFPLATLGTIFGMNLKHGLEEWNAPWIFWLVLAGAFASGLLLASAIVGRRAPKPAAGRAGGKERVGAGRKRASNPPRR